MAARQALTAPVADIPSMVRVDHAGEYGATRIYAGQLAVLGTTSPAGRAIVHMAQQEDAHLAHFEGMLRTRRIRPTLLHPFWNVAGYALGVATALISPRAAMACCSVWQMRLPVPTRPRPSSAGC